MGEVSAAVPNDAPVMIAWTGYQKTEQFANATKWASSPEHLLGSLWTLFYAGFYAAAMQAAESAAETDLPLTHAGEGAKT